MTSTFSKTVAKQLESIEILRSSLRWSHSLEHEQILSIREQVDQMRSDLLLALSSDSFKEESEEQGVKRKVIPLSERQRRIAEDISFQGIFGENEQLLETLEIIKKVSPSEIPILISGESGTGKELVAQTIHKNSKRSHGPFVTVNCGAIPDSLVESELFGHIKGAFTGATSDRKGKFEAAGGGTIFLDEIGDLPLTSQVKILRVVQEREVQRVGSDQLHKVDVRVVSATHRKLNDMIKTGTFREDLFYRISVVEVEMPPLRNRRDEIPFLVDYFVNEAVEAIDREHLAMDSDLMGFFLSYEFPGNIRELRNIIYRIVSLADKKGRIKHLPPSLRYQEDMGKTTKERPASNTLQQIKESVTREAERAFILHGLKAHNGKITDFAKDAGMNRSYLQNLMKKHGIEAKSFK